MTAVLFKIMLIRHAEEADATSGAQNVDDRGAPEAGGLSVQGWQRAGALVRFLAPVAGHAAHSHLARPTAVFAMDATAAQPTRRPALTVGPLAQALSLPVQLVADDAALLHGLRNVRGPALVCWRHRSLPALARLLAPKAAVPPDWPEHRNDLVWVIEPPHNAASSTASLRQIPQLLLPGDGRSPIGV